MSQCRVDGTEEDRKGKSREHKVTPFILVLLFAIWLRLGWER